jgi:hypothetical protein
MAQKCGYYTANPLCHFGSAFFLTEDGLEIPAV